jgi:acyl-CoA-dependent ceramide synthase
LTSADVCSSTGLAFNLIALIFLAHMFIPKARAHTQKFFYLTYFNPKSNNYAHGADDCYFIFFCIVLFTGLRAWSMEYLLAPLGKYMGIAKRKDLTRFSEQGWMLMYYIVFWNLGMVGWSPCYFDGLPASVR